MTLFEGNYVLIPMHRGEEGEFLIRIYSEKFVQQNQEKSIIFKSVFLEVDPAYASSKLCKFMMTGSSSFVGGSFQRL